MSRISVAALTLLAAGMVYAADDSGVTFIGHEQVAKGGSLATAPNLSIMVAHRTEAGMSEVHDNETDTFYVLAGAATIVTGGKMLGSNTTAPGQHRGSGIEGGEARQLVAGDVMVIPAGVAHWFKEVPNSIDYYVVKVIAP